MSSYLQKNDIHWEDTVFFKESHNILERIGNQTKLFLSHERMILRGVKLQI